MPWQLFNAKETIENHSQQAPDALAPKAYKQDHIMWYKFTKDKFNN